MAKFDNKVKDDSNAKQAALAKILPDDFSRGMRNVPTGATAGEEAGDEELLERLMAMTQSNNVLVVATDDESNHIATCVLPYRVFSGSPARACRKFAELSRMLDEAESESHATVSIIRYDPTDGFSGVYYSTRTHMADGWRAPLRCKVHRHLVDAIAATKMWRALPFMEYKKSLQ